MTRTPAMRNLRTARFGEVYERWTGRQITQAHAAGLLGVSEQTFRRYVRRFRESGLKGLEDRRVRSSRRAPAEEVATLVRLYAERYSGWRVRPFFRVYRDKFGGGRSYTWVKNRLHESGLVTPGRAGHSTPTESVNRRPAEGLLLHQAGCTCEWLPNRVWELVALVDDASRRVHSGLFVASEVILCRFRTVHETVEAHGLFEAIHVDRALRNDHDCRKTGGFPDAMRKLQITVLPTCRPKARSMYLRLFRVLREALPQQLADAGIQSPCEANRFLPSYWKRFNRFVAIQPKQSTPAFDPLEPGFESEIAEILWQHDSHRLGDGNGVGPRG